MAVFKSEMWKSVFRKRLMMVIGLIAVVALGVVLLRFGSETPSQTGKPKKPKPLVVVQTAQLGRIADILEQTGSVEPVVLARLASPAEGPVLSCTVREGDKVKKGDEILVIGRKKAADALLLSAELDLEAEKEELERIEKLVGSNAIPREQLQNEKAKYARMKAQLEKMKETSADYEIIVPWDGVVSKVLVAAGNYVAARTVLLEMFDPRSLVIRVAVPEARSQQVVSGMDVSLSLDAYPGTTFRGKISRVYPELDRKMRTRTVEILAVDPVELAPGMFARVDIALKSDDQTVVVPIEAVMATEKETRLAYVIDGGKAFERQVTTGIEAKGKVQILKGINPGDQLVIAGNEKLKNGMEVSIQSGKEGSGSSKKPGSSPKEGAVQ